MKTMATLLLALMATAVTAQTGFRVPEVSGIDDPHFPWVELTLAPDGQVRLPFDAEIVAAPELASVAAAFPGALFLKMHEDYQLAGQDRSLDYGLVLYRIDVDTSLRGPHKRGDIVGKARAQAPRLVAWSSSLDPYLVLSSPKKPASTGGALWFAPEFLFSNGGTAYFSFQPIESLEKTLDNVASEAEEAPGFDFYPHLKVRFPLTLPGPVRSLTEEEKSDLATFEDLLYGRKGLMTHASDLTYQGRHYLLCWQKGFDQYLSNETQPGQSLWLFGSVVSYDVFKKVGYVFVRDFSPHSVEEMVESRLSLFRVSP